MTLKIFRLYELHEYSFMVVFKLEHNFDGETSDLNILVCSDDLLCRAANAGCTPGQSVGRYVLCGSTPDPVSVVGVLPCYDDVPEFNVYPNRVLETVASLADMTEYSTSVGVDKNGYYRADTVAMIFNTEHLMDKTIQMVTRDVRIHVKAIEGQTLDTEIKAYSHITDDALRDYYFRG
jgi:hypothetical protein